MPKNKDQERAYHVLNQVIELAKSGKQVVFSNDSFEELTLSVGSQYLNHRHISGDGSRSTLIDKLGETLDDLAKENS